MTEHQFFQIGLEVGHVIMIHMLSGSTTHGAYLGNYNNSKQEFELSNHSNGQIERVVLSDVDSIII